MTKITAFGQDSSPSTDDLLTTIDITSGLNKKVLISDFITLMFSGLSASQIASALAAASSLGQNLIINGGMNVWQRNTTFTPNDDVFTADRWNALVEANASWTFARDTDVPTTGGMHYSMKCSNVTLNNQCALVYILEGKDAIPLAGQNVSASFFAKTSGTEIANLRCAILSWNSTEDSVTSDVINTWAQNGTNPTWASNWTMENTPSNLALTSSWQEFSVENVSIDTSGTKNIAVVIWVDDGTIAANDDFWITGVQLNAGSKALPYVQRPFVQELHLCLRYYEKSYFYTTVPGTAGYTNCYTFCGTSESGSALVFNIPFKAVKRSTPTITSYLGSTGASGSWEYARSGASGTSVFNNNNTGDSSINAYVVVGAAWVAANVTGHWTAEAEL